MLIIRMQRLLADFSTFIYPSHDINKIWATSYNTPPYIRYYIILNIAIDCSSFYFDIDYVYLPMASFVRFRRYFNIINYLIWNVREQFCKLLRRRNVEYCPGIS